MEKGVGRRFQGGGRKEEVAGNRGRRPGKS